MKCLLATLFLASVAFAQMTHEESVVRTAYAKLSYAVDLNTAYEQATRNHQLTPARLSENLEGHALRFSLSNFKVGNLSEIADEKYAGALGQYPDGQDIVHVALVQARFEEGGKPVVMEVAKAQWGPGPEGTPPDKAVAAMMPTMQRESGIASPLVRYCKYTVTATLDGRSRTYEAHFLFAEDGEVATGDVVSGIGGGPLRHFVTHPVYPTILLKTSLWKNAAVHTMVESNQRPESDCKGGSDICCDVSTLRCGVSSADIRSLQ